MIYVNYIYHSPVDYWQIIYIKVNTKNNRFKPAHDVFGTDEQSYLHHL